MHAIFTMKKIFLSIVLTCLSSIGFAQIHEVGFFAGGSNFIGDVGRTNYIYPNKFSGGVVYKYNLNPRIAIRGNYNYIPISGDNAERSSVLNDIVKGRKFSNTLHEIAAGIEFNFFEYDINNYRKAHTPYILTQFSAFRHKIVEAINNNATVFKDKTSYAIPIGIGLKGKLSDNLAYAIEGRIMYSFADDLDYTTSEIPRLDFGGNGNDWYAFTGFSIVYSFGRPPCYTSMR